MLSVKHNSIMAEATGLIFHDLTLLQPDLSMQKTAKLYKKGAAFTSQGEKSCEIKGGSHEIAVIMLMIIHFNNACTGF